MQFQFDFRKFDGRCWHESGSCCVSSNLSSLPSWVQGDMSKWKSGSKFSVLIKKTIDGKSVYVEKFFELNLLDEKTGPY